MKWDNNPESIHIILTAYLDEYAEAEKTLRTLFDSQNWEEIYIFSHSLKGLLVDFGEKNISEILAEIEQKTQTGQSVDEHLINQTCLALPEIHAQIQTELSYLLTR